VEESATVASVNRSIRIRWVGSADEISEAIWAECFASPLEGLWWYRVMERSGMEDQFNFFYAVIEQPSQVLGIAPCFVHDVPMDLVAPPMVAKVLISCGRIYPALRYQRTLFIGSPSAEEGAVGLIPGVQLEEVAPVLHQAVMERSKREGAMMIVWKDFSLRNAAALKVLLQQGGMFQAVSFPGTRVLLPTGGFTEYLNSLSSSHRHNLKKKLKRGAETGEVITKVTQHPDEDTLKEVFSLFSQTYEKGTTKFEKLNIRFFEEIAKTEQSYFILLRLKSSGRLAAFMLCFLLKPRAINKFIGINYALQGDWFLYFRLWQQAVEWASAAGCEEIQSGQTGYRAKLDLEHALVPLINCCQNRIGLLNWLYAKVAAGITWETLDPVLAIFARSKRRRNADRTPPPWLIE
jgi:uncharacterized protein